MRSSSFIQPILVRRSHAMWRAGIVDVPHTLDEPGGLSCGIVYWHDLIIFAMQDQRGYVELLQILGAERQIGLQEGAQRSNS